MVDTLIGRKRMKSTTWQVVKDVFYSCVPCKKQCLSKRVFERRSVFQKAQHLLDRSFNVKNLLRNSNLIKIMLRSMFTKEQSLLFLFQRKQVIDPDQSLTSEASDLDFRENFDTKLCSRNPWEQIFALYKIFNVLKAFEGKKLEQIDK